LVLSAIAALESGDILSPDFFYVHDETVESMSGFLSESSHA